MSRNYTITIDDKLYEKLQNQFSEMGIDFDEGVNYVLSFFVDDNITPITVPKVKNNSNRNISYNENDKVSKVIAERLFQRNDCIVFNTYTYASRGKSGSSSSDIYWANPRLEFVNKDWSIVLNDKKESKLYLLNIPKNSFNKQAFIVRTDKPELIDMRIRCGDHYYRDLASGISLQDYLIAIIDYSDFDSPKFTRIK